MAAIVLTLISIICAESTSITGPKQKLNRDDALYRHFQLAVEGSRQIFRVLEARSTRSSA